MSESEAALRAKYAPPLPDALKRQVAQTNEMLAGGAMSPANEVPAAPVGGQVQPGTEGAVQGSPADAGGGESQPKPATSSVPAVPAATPPADAPNDEVASLKAALAQAEQEARTWKGRERKTREEMDAIQAQIDDLKAKLADATKAPEPKALDPLSEEDVETYGRDLLDAAARFVMPMVMERLRVGFESLTARLDALENKAGRTAAVVAKTEWETFIDAVTARLPSWKKIDAMPEFTAWLDSEDPLMGEPRRKGLDSAIEARNVERVARFFETFASQSGVQVESQSAARGTVPAAGTEEKAKPTPTAPQVEDQGPTLEALAAPGRPAPSPPSAQPIVQPGARIWTVTEITNYYAARTKSDHPHFTDHAAARAMDAEIAAAQREGRVRVA